MQNDHTNDINAAMHIMVSTKPALIMLDMLGVQDKLQIALILMAV